MTAPAAKPAPLILAFDSSGPWCAVALVQGDRVLARRFEETAKGQAERLMPLVQSVMEEAGTPFDRLDAIAVGIGPGNFTGIRIAVSAARGLALALGRPAVGVSGFEAMRGPASRRDPAPQLVSLPAPRDGLYLQRFKGGREAGAPVSLTRIGDVDWDALGMTRDTPILGVRADDLSGLFRPAGGAEGPPWSRSALPGSDLASTIGRIAADKLAQGTDLPRPAPLYVRPADAAPSSDPGPVILP